MAKQSRVAPVAVLIGIALALPALAQTGATAAPDSSWRATICTFGRVPAVKTYGRPGLKDFLFGAEAFRQKDYRHAVYMYKVAASYDDAAAEYDLGLMYFRGNGVPVSKPLGAAWTSLATEQGTPLYVEARDLMEQAMTKAQATQADTLLNQLQKTYGKVGLTQAKLAFVFARKDASTCSHLAVVNCGSLNATLGPGGHLLLAPGAGVSGALGYLSYRQMLSAKNLGGQPLMKCPSGSVHVGPLQQVKAGQGDAKSRQSASSGTQPKGL